MPAAEFGAQARLVDTIRREKDVNRISVQRCLGSFEGCEDRCQWETRRSEMTGAGREEPGVLSKEVP